MRRLAITLGAFASAALAVAQPMSGSPPKQAQGTEVTIAAVTTQARMADGNLIEERLATRLLTGTVTGTVVSRLTRITYKDGDRLSHGFQTCDPCEVEGRTGSIVFRTEARTTEKTEGTEAHLTVVDATGELEGLHAILEVVVNSYTGTYHFDPS
jgi:hypothetical protein